MSSALSPVTPDARYRRLRIAYTLGILLVIIVFVFIWINPYLIAGSVLLRVGDPKASGFLANYDTNPVTTKLTTFATPVRPVLARFYIPVGIQNPPAMIILHGVHHLGIEEPRLVNFSRALASHGVLVMTPELTDLADYHVEPQSIDVIGLSAQELKRRTGANSVSVLGLSFAGSLGLLAAADPKYRNDISVVASIGGYDDLARVLRYYATNSIVGPNGQKFSLPAHEYGILVVAYSHPGEFFSEQDVPLAREALKQQLYENVNAAKEIAARLSPPGRKVMEALLEHQTQVLSADLLAALKKHEAEPAEVSPAGKLGDIKADVFLAHGAGDNVIPPTETEWLARDVPPARLKEVLISPVISHVEVDGKSTFADDWRLVHFMEEFLHDTAEKARTHSAFQMPSEQVPANQ
jgi:pimeloyl-ACP methyl ester carboxylesterase